ncbi:MAG: acyltransferase [Halioglobus sp.]
MTVHASRLIDYDGNRRNNFTILRIVLAWLVLYRHAYPIQFTPGAKDPLQLLFLGSATAGEIAVNGFFAISGFLVVASLVRRGVKDYSLSRILRIYPALILCTVLSVFVLGPLFTTLSLSDYFSRSATFDYLWNALGVLRMEWSLPGVFESNARRAVNGSLWSITVETRCYILLAVAGLFGAFRDRTTANFLMIAVFLFSLGFFADVPLIGINPKWSRPGLFFLIGVFFYVNRDRVYLDIRLALLAAILAYSSFGTPWYPHVFPLSFVYLIFYLAYTTRYIDTDGKIGDISYGIYIYAFPVQQMVAHLFPDFTPLKNVALSTLVVIPMAYLSWHYIEKPCLRLKQKLS